MDLEGGNPIARIAEHQGVMILDGGLATTLEARGYDLHDDLWSAKLLLEAPNAIQDVQRSFLDAGADCIATATYQASLEGLEKRGLNGGEARELLRMSVRHAVDVRDTFWSEPANRTDRVRPLVAASIGPYGAFLADGSEFTGDYGVSEDDLHAFHCERWYVFAESDADLLACETIPSAVETSALLRLASTTPDRWIWLSFSCRDGKHLNDGTDLADVARACDGEPSIAAIGINCTAPEHIASLISEARAATETPIIVYPNSGETYDVASRTWVHPPAAINWEDAAAEWLRVGASGVGGCCRVGPETVGAIRQRLTV